MLIQGSANEVVGRFAAKKTRGLAHFCSAPILQVRNAFDSEKLGMVASRAAFSFTFPVTFHTKVKYLSQLESTGHRSERDTHTDTVQSLNFCVAEEEKERPERSDFSSSRGAKNCNYLSGQQTFSSEFQRASETNLQLVWSASWLAVAS